MEKGRKKKGERKCCVNAFFFFISQRKDSVSSPIPLPVLTPHPFHSFQPPSESSFSSPLSFAPSTSPYHLNSFKNPNDRSFVAREMNHAHPSSVSSVPRVIDVPDDPKKSLKQPSLVISQIVLSLPPFPSMSIFSPRTSNLSSSPSSSPPLSHSLSTFPPFLLNLPFSSCCHASSHMLYSLKPPLSLLLLPLPLLFLIQHASS